MGRAAAITGSLSSVRGCWPRAGVPEGARDLSVQEERVLAGGRGHRGGHLRRVRGRAADVPRPSAARCAATSASDPIAPASVRRSDLGVLGRTCDDGSRVD
eukprot:scaffold349_cov352-Prasinococcus_capsulatus_cf.AAC.5